MLFTFVVTNIKVVVFVCILDLFPSYIITPFSDSISPIHAYIGNCSQGCNQWRCMTWINVNGQFLLNGNGWNLQTEIVVYNDKLWKFKNNLYYFTKIYFLRRTPLCPTFYKPKCFWMKKLPLTILKCLNSQE
jgi:hypothetical protein